MRYFPPSNQLFIKNRQKLKSSLSNSITVVFSNPVVNHNSDANYNFIQNSDFYYLTGIDQADCAIIIFPDSKDKSLREILFIKKNNPNKRIWDGDLISIDQAKELSGINNVLYIEEFDFWFNMISSTVEGYIYIDYKAEVSHVINDKYSNLIKTYPLLEFKSLQKLTSHLRVIKEPEELEMIRRAISITQHGLNELQNCNFEELYEYQVEAILTGKYVNEGSRRHAFAPIVAGGKNATVLHYINNAQKLQKGELVLIDTGAEYGNYNADITRVYPISGKFSPVQKEVYTAVLSALKSSMNSVKPGISLRDFNSKMVEIVKIELKSLNLIKSTQGDEYRKYYMHGGSHFLGLDVHDVGNRDTILQPGMVITVEPGIYIAEQNIGVRLENDILITENGIENLSIDIPIEISEIEG